MTAIQPPSSTFAEVAPIVCGAGCKRVVADEKTAQSASWSFLPISRRWRCPACWRELYAANHQGNEQT